jgi:diadenosine tetraphosphate (Ap4A) HIT family hydrolase
MNDNSVWPNDQDDVARMVMSSVDTADFRIEACHDCPVPGYLIVSAHEPVTSLSELSEAAQASLGVVLALCVEAVTALLHPDQVYTARFSEESRGVHFHVFPRTAEVTAAFRGAHPHDSGIDGPKLLSWVRSSYRVEDPTASSDLTSRVLQLIRSRLGQNDMETRP